MEIKLENPIREQFRIARSACTRGQSGRVATVDAGSNPAHSPNPVTVYRVHPLVWQAALRAADGVVARIERVSEFEVIVR